MHEKPEITRKLVDAAISTGRYFQSPQTGMVQYFHSIHADSIHHTVPIYENVLFALALFRSKVIENIREAQNLLVRILAFQTEEGNFPTYLHEYPSANSFALAIHLQAPFYWLLKIFGHVLGQELRNAVENCVKKLVSYALKSIEVKQFNFSMIARLSAGLSAFGSRFDIFEWQEKGKDLLEGLIGNKENENLIETSHIADILIAMSMAEEDLRSPSWDRIIAFIKRTWHAQTAAYCGPCIHEYQNRFYPQTTLYELYMGYLSGYLELRNDGPCIQVLEAALVHPISAFEVVQIGEDEFEGCFNDSVWVCFKREERALTLMQKQAYLDEKILKTYTPFRLLYGNPSRPHSLVCQGGNARDIQYSRKGSIFELIFELDRLKENGQELSREVCFFLDIYPEAEISLRNLRTTVFDLGQEIRIKLNEGEELTMSFELMEGDGNFLGHIAQANRPSQLKQAEANKFQVYDWTIFLRTLRRSENCKIKVTIDLNSLLS